MRGVLHKYLWQQGEQGEQVENGASTPTVDETVGGEGPRLQESEQDLRYEVVALRAEVVDLCERRREQELDWRRRALRWLRWQLPLTWCLHGLLRGLVLIALKLGQ